MKNLCYRKSDGLIFGFAYVDFSQQDWYQDDPSSYEIINISQELEMGPGQWKYNIDGTVERVLM